MDNILDVVYMQLAVWLLTMIVGVAAIAYIIDCYVSKKEKEADIKAGLTDPD